MLMKDRGRLFLGNAIRTTKYNAFNFFPKVCALPISALTSSHARPLVSFLSPGHIHLVCLSAPIAA